MRKTTEWIRFITFTRDMLLVLLLLMYLKKFKSIKSNRLFCNEARKTQSWRCIATSFASLFNHSNFYNWWFRWFLIISEFMQIFCVLGDEHVSYYTPQIFIYLFLCFFLFFIKNWGISRAYCFFEKIVCASLESFRLVAVIPS